MLARRDDPPVLHHADQIRVHDRRDPLGDDEFGGIGNVGAESLPDQRVGTGIDRAGRIVEDQDLRTFEQRPRDAETLFLPARDIGAALLDLGFVSVGETADELIRLREPTRLGDLLVGRAGVAPEQVFPDRAREQQILLQNHRDRVAERLGIVFAHVAPADAHRAGGNVVEPRDQLDEGRFARPGTAEDPDGHPGLDMQIHVRERVLVRRGGVFEGDRIEIDRPVGDLGHGVFGIGERRDFAEHFVDPARRFGGDGQGDEDHHQHHQLHHDLEPVGDHPGHMPDVDGRAAAADHEIRTEEQDENEIEVDAALHQGRVDGDDALGVGNDLLQRK